jgi:SHS2 domain-containing protein
MMPPRREGNTESDVGGRLLRQLRVGAYEHFEHGADIGVRGFGRTPAEAFTRCAEALFSLLAHDLRGVRPLVEERFACQAPGLEELLVAFLNELIFLADSRGFVFGRFEVAIETDSSGSHRLTGVARGEPLDPERHESTVEPKGATFTQLRVAQEEGQWVAQCVVDV